MGMGRLFGFELCARTAMSTLNEISPAVLFRLYPCHFVVLSIHGYSIFAH